MPIHLAAAGIPSRLRSADTYSETLFKALRYCPDFAAHSGSTNNVRTHCQQHFRQYRHVRCDGKFGLMAPAVAPRQP